MNIVQYRNQQTLFFVSGMFGGDWVWSRCREHIKGTDHIVMANPLCALSSSLDSIIKMVMKEIDSHPDKITLVGSSMGGMLSLAIAKQFPDKIQQVLITGTAGFDKVDLKIKMHPRRADSIASEIMSMVCYDESKLSQPDVNSVAGEFKHNFKSIVNLIRESDKLDGEAILESVNCPVHALWGAQDVVTPLSSVSEVFGRLNIPLTILENCGHCPMYERPLEFSSWVNSCLVTTEKQFAYAA